MTLAWQSTETGLTARGMPIDADGRYWISRDAAGSPLATPAWMALNQLTLARWRANLLTLPEQHSADSPAIGNGVYEIAVPQEAAAMCHAVLCYDSAAPLPNEYVDAVQATIDKTGYKLAADGLDAIATSPPNGPATTFREMVVQTWRRFFRKATKNATTIQTYADDEQTVLTTQAIGDSDGNETQGSAI
jgi:hypothetical protein